MFPDTTLMIKEKKRQFIATWVFISVALAIGCIICSSTAVCLVTPGVRKCGSVAKNRSDGATGTVGQMPLIAPQAHCKQTCLPRTLLVVVALRFPPIHFLWFTLTYSSCSYLHLIRLTGIVDN